MTPDTKLYDLIIIGLDRPVAAAGARVRGEKNLRLWY